VLREPGLGASGVGHADADADADAGIGFRGVAAAEPTETGHGNEAAAYVTSAEHGFGAAEAAGGAGPGTVGSPAAGLSGPGEQGSAPSQRPALDILPTASTSAPTSAPQGFGPPLASVTPVPQPSPPTGPIARPAPSPRRKTRILIAAVAVAVVLAGAGVAVAHMVNSGDTTVTSRPTSSPSGVGVALPTGRTDADRSPDPGPTGQGDDGTQAPTQQHTGKGESTTAGQAPSAAPTRSTSSDGGTTGGSAPTTGAASPSPSTASACQSIGGGKYNCQVWRSAKSYTASGTEAGVLGAGTNYFYCQQNLGRRETYGQWTNVWWAKTDDDSGNTNVYVSDVYLKGGDNDEPVPGLPVC